MIELISFVEQQISCGCNHTNFNISNKSKLTKKGEKRKKQRKREKEEE